MGALLKAKTFIDTVVYRSAISGESWAYVGLVALGFSLTGVVIVTMPVSTLGWLGLGWDDDNPGVTKTHSSVTFQEIQPSFSRIQGTEHNHCWNPAHSWRAPFMHPRASSGLGEATVQHLCAGGANLCSASIAFTH